MSYGQNIHANGVVHFKYERFGIVTFDLTLKDNRLTGRNVPLEGQPEAD